MKNKVILLLIVLFSTVVNAQIVDIPDSNLKFILITYPVADLGNGFNEIADTNGDGEIQISEAESVIGLQLVEQFIADLEGLQYFVNLEEIDCSQNYLIDYIPTPFWPNLKFLESDDNNLTAIDITQNPLLEVLILDFNPLMSLDISQNLNLKELSISGCQFYNLNITQNSILEILHCNGNQLTNLNIQNGNNNLLWSMIASNNPDLNCIQVDDVDYANNQSNWHKDETAIYSEDCNLGIEDNLKAKLIIYPNPAKEIIQIESDTDIKSIKVYDVLGKLVLRENNFENQLSISALNNGLYFLKIETDNGVMVKKIIKKSY